LTSHNVALYHQGDHSPGTRSSPTFHGTPIYVAVTHAMHIVHTQRKRNYCGGSERGAGGGRSSRSWKIV